MTLIYTAIRKPCGLLAFGTNILRYSPELDSLLMIYKWERMGYFAVPGLFLFVSSSAVMEELKDLFRQREKEKVVESIPFSLWE